MPYSLRKTAGRSPVPMAMPTPNGLPQSDYQVNQETAGDFEVYNGKEDIEVDSPCEIYIPVVGGVQ